MAAADTRELVLEILLLITRDGEYSHIALRSVLSKYQFLSKQDRAFITRVVEGTLERMMELDYIIGQYSSVKVEKLKPVIRAILRSAVYQMKYMDGVPDSAVCNEAVKLAARKGFVNLKGFVNGVLRNIGRNLDSISYPGGLYGLSVKYSMPEWILKNWLSAYDLPVVEGMLRDFLAEKPTSVRCTLHKITKEGLIRRLRLEGVRVEEHPDIPYALLLSGYDHLGALQSFQEGLFQVQDASSMLAAEWADPKAGDYIIDVCAAPGGKALHLADKLAVLGAGHVEARDLTDSKIRMIQENIARVGAENIEVFKWDAEVLREESVGRADIVVADLPCSGLGVLGKKPDIKYKMTKEQQQELARLQRRILSVVKEYVKPGGKLIYSTCTIHRAENEENAAWFTSSFPEFHLMRERQMLPGQDGTDGFYIAQFRKEQHG